MPPLNPYDVRIAYGSTTIRARLAKGQTGEPEWHRGSAPALSAVINTEADSRYESIPPEQGRDVEILDVSRGAGAYDYEEGRYAFGESVETSTGVVYPGPAVVADTVNGAAALDGPVWSQAWHNDTDFIAAGKKVYYWDYNNTIWQKTTTDPAAGAATKITDIHSFSSATLTILLVCFDTVSDYQYSTNNGVTWLAPAGGGQRKFKHFTTWEERTTRPILVGVNDPDILYKTEDPTDATLWDTGTRIGSGGSQNSEHFTSVATAPTGELLVGKRFGWRTMDSFSNVSMGYGRVQTSSGAGLENFAWPARVGQSLFVPIRDFDILRYERGVFTPGYGVSRFGPRVPEMQKAVVALAGDDTTWLYAALAGTDGYVMRGREVGGKWEWHGSYARIGKTIHNRMWVSSYPLSANGNTNQYLVVSTKDTPYLPYRMVIPNQSLDTDLTADAYVRFVTSASIRFGYVDAAQPHVTKILGQAIPETKNLATGSKTLTLAYRINSAEGFTDLATFYDSPEPSNLNDTFFPSGTSCKRFEMKATLTGSTSTDKICLERMVIRAYRRPIRADSFQITILAEDAMATIQGGDSGLSWQDLQTKLFEARDSVTPPLLVNERNQAVWSVDIQDIKEDWVKAGDGSRTGQSAPAMAFTLTMVELPTLGAISAAASAGVLGNTGAVCGAPHTHRLDSFTGTSAQLAFVLGFTPIGPVEVHVGATYQIEGTNFSQSGTTITFVAAPALSAAIRVEYPHS